MSFCVLFVCKCVLYYCHRVATQLQWINIPFHHSNVLTWSVFTVLSLCDPVALSVKILRRMKICDWHILYFHDSKNLHSFKLWNYKLTSLFYHIPLSCTTKSERLILCRHDTDNINIDKHIGTRYVILSKHWMWLPDDGFMWTETYWSSFYNFNCFNNLRILRFVCDQPRGLVVRVSDFQSIGLGFDSRLYHGNFFW